MILFGQEQEFSDSDIWKWQEAKYQEYGPLAWGQKGVPSYLTTSPLMAKHYAELVYSYYLDLLTRKDLAEPIWIFDLGAGSGRFAYLFLQELENLSEAETFPFHYVLTDIVKENIAFWMKHPLLQKWWEKGVLEACEFHHGQKASLFLEKEKKEHSFGKNPIVLIANYFFDTISQSLWKIQNKDLLKGFITILKKEEKEENEIKNFKETYSYYPETLCELEDIQKKIMQEYLNQEKDVTFLFPKSPFEAIDFFRKNTKGPLLLLAADQGIGTKEEWQKGMEPEIHKHGTFSVPVNYHAIGRYFSLLGGKALIKPSFRPYFVIGAFSLGNPSLPKVKKTWENTVLKFSIRDFWFFIESLSKKEKNIALPTLFAALFLGEGDPHILYFWYKEIKKELPFVEEEEEKNAWKKILIRTAENFFPIEETDSAFLLNVAVLFYELKDYKEALYWFEQTKNLGLDTDELKKNIELCKSYVNKR